MSDFRNLRALCLAVLGRPPVGIDWAGVVSLANRALLTPALAATVASLPAATQPPEAVSAFLAEVMARNRERNRRLSAQLEEIVQMLASVEVECTLLKGAAFLAEPGPQADRRIISDLDVLLAASDLERGGAALEQAGFQVSARYPEGDSHVAMEMFRESDVGAIDLHRRPPGPRQVMFSTLLAERSTRTPFGAGHVRIPTAEVRILHLAMHDQFHDGDFWSGALDLRHLLDIAALAARDPDWDLLSPRLLGGLCYRALCRELIDAHELFEANLPPSFRANLGGELHHRRAMLQLRWPAVRGGFSLLTLLAEAPAGFGHYRREWRFRAASGISTVSSRQRALGRMARLRDTFNERPISKI